MTEKPHIKVWPFHDAPEEYQRIGNQGGDEDWLAFIPDALQTPLLAYTPWLEAPAFGCCDVDWHDVDGGQIAVSTHS